MKKKNRQGFASMDEAKHREIARLGGKMAHKLGVAHEWTAQEAKAAGRKGGLRRGPRPLGDLPIEEARQLFLKRLENTE